MTNPEGYTALDLVGYTDKGDYSVSTAYVKNDLVNYGGAKWRCLIDDTTGVTPAEGLNWTKFIEHGVTESEFEEAMEEIDNRFRRTRKQFTNLSLLASAAADQNLEKYGLSIGDYYIGASGYKYTIADIDTFYGGYNSYAIVNTHHIALVVDTNTNSKWNDTDDTSSGYNGSALHAFLKGTVLTNIQNDLGSSHLLAHQKLLTTGTSAWAWQENQYISALSEIQVYGSTVWFMNGHQTGEGRRQLELFRKFDINTIVGNVSVWLRNIMSSSSACYADRGGYAGYFSASGSLRAVGLILFK